ncbi:hypothetical protein [Actinomadura rifamycini]|uniref:hypothetical protein n=1 Tax=Actinomadura rifamycini TaxID=31962 RepID=UPI0004207E4C|nr:hypothetical protein [Actinomadura rifamycini]
MDTGDPDTGDPDTGGAASGSAGLGSARFAGPGTVVADDGSRRWTPAFDPDDVRAIDTLPSEACEPGLYTG